MAKVDKGKMNMNDVLLNKNFPLLIDFDLCNRYFSISMCILSLQGESTDISHVKLGFLPVTSFFYF